MKNPPAFPQPLARLIGRLPALPASLALSALVNMLAWRGLGELDWSEMRGRRFCVRAKDTGLRMYFTVGAKGLQPLTGEQADVTFTATALDLARLALRMEDPDTLFFNRRLLIEGDTDLGLRAKNMLDTVEIETIAGHLPAGKLMLKKCRSWFSQPALPL